MNVVFCSSNLYSKCTGIAILSLLSNNEDIGDLDVYLITTDMSCENKKRIKQICSDFKRQVFFIDGNKVLNSAKNEFSLLDFKGGLNTYARAMANYLLPESVKKALFLDSDILVTGGLSDLECMDMGENIVAGVYEISVLIKNLCYEDVRLLNQCPYYINYGVAYINLENWRNQDGDKLIQETVKNYKANFRVAEQSILNLAFRNKTMIIPLKYNFSTYVHGITYGTLTKRYKRRSVFSEEEFAEANVNPIILHFIGDYFNRPWFENNICKYRDTYLMYYQKSPWSMEKLDIPSQDISTTFKVYYKVLIFLRKHNFDNAYFRLRYILIQWLREHISNFDSKVKRKVQK